MANSQSNGPKSFDDFFSLQTLKTNALYFCIVFFSSIDTWLLYVLQTVKCMCWKVKLLIWCGKSCPATTARTQALRLLCKGNHVRHTLWVLHLTLLRKCYVNHLISHSYWLILYNFIYVSLRSSLQMCACTSELFPNITEISGKCLVQMRSTRYKLSEQHVQNGKLYNFPRYIFALL